MEEIMIKENRDSLYTKILNKYGIEKQKWMLIEECGELLNALAKYERGRATREEVITELADVHIMVEQMAIHFGEELFQIEKGLKLKRMVERISKG